MFAIKHVYNNLIWLQNEQWEINDPCHGLLFYPFKNRTERRLTIELKSISWKNVFLLLS